MFLKHPTYNIIKNRTPNIGKHQRVYSLKITLPHQRYSLRNCLYPYLFDDMAFPRLFKK